MAGHQHRVFQSAMYHRCASEISRQSQHSLSLQDDIGCRTHAEDVSSWIEAIAHCITNNSSPMRLMDLQNALKLSIVETWLGLLLGDFKLEQRGSFYDSSEIWIS